MKYYVNIVLIIVVLLVSHQYSNSQVYSIDVKPKSEHRFSLKKIFSNHGGKEKRKANRDDRQKFRKQKKANKQQRKAVKKYWKTVDRPKEMAANKKVVRRMRRDLRKSGRINKNRHPDNFFVRLSHLKIKLPKISETKIHWPWAKKHKEE